MKYIAFLLYIIIFFRSILFAYLKNLKAFPIKIKDLSKKSHIFFEFIHFIGYSFLVILMIPVVISPIYFIDFLNYEGYYLLMVLGIFINLIGFAFKK